MIRDLLLMLYLKKIEQKLNIIWVDFIYFLSIFKISKGVNGFVKESLLNDFRLSFNLMSSYKLILVPYALFLFIFGYYFSFHEYFSQSNMIASFTLITIVICVTLIFMFLLYLPLIAIMCFSVSMLLKSIFSNILRIISGITTVFIMMNILHKHPIEINDYFHWVLVDLFIIVIIIMVVMLLIIRNNVNKLYNQEPLRVKKNFLLKVFKFDNPFADKLIRITCILFIIPFLIFQTVSYKIFLFNFLQITNQIVVNSSVPLNYQQYQLLMPQNQDCKIDKYTYDLIYKHQITEDKQVCIQSSNILKQGIADEYILIVKKEDNSLSKIYCVNTKCNGAQVQNKGLAEILMAPTFNHLTNYFSKH